MKAATAIEPSSISGSGPPSIQDTTPNVLGPVRPVPRSGTFADSRKVVGTMRAEKLQKVDRKTGQVVGLRWKFWVYDPDKKQSCAVPVSSVPQHIRGSQNPDEVHAYVKSQNAVQDTVRHRAQMRREWKEKYHNFQEYLDRFAEYQKERAPNSWENDIYYLSTYAFAFFLSKSSLNNLNEWHFLFDEFRQWLKETPPLKYRKQHLSLNTQVKVIKALNRFMDFCFSKGWILQSPKCPNHKRGDTLVVTADDLIRPEEIFAIRDKLREIRPKSADLFMVLANSGMRINEAIGLSYKFVTEGKIDGPSSVTIHNALERYGLDEYRGYICLESQPARSCARTRAAWIDRFRKTWPKGSVPRKPLKCRRRIAPEYFRHIPIYSDEGSRQLFRV